MVLQTQLCLGGYHVPARLCREVRDHWPWYTHRLLCKQHAPARECLHSHQCCLLGGPQELSPRTNHSRTEKRDWLLMEHSVIIFGSFGTISAPSLRLQVAQMHPRGQQGSWRWLIQLPHCMRETLRSPGVPRWMCATCVPAQGYPAPAGSPCQVPWHPGSPC